MSDTSDPLTERLHSLAPSTGRFTRDRVIFEAGRADGRRALVGWRIATGICACLTLMLAGWISLRPVPTEIIERTVPVMIPSEPEETPPEPYPVAPEFTGTYSGPDFSDPQIRRAFQIRRDVLRWGIDHLPAPPRRSEPIRTESPEEFREWLGLPPTSGIYASPRGF